MKTFYLSLTLVAAAALTGMTAANIAIDRTVVTTLVTTGRVYVRQTVDSGNAGTIRVIVEYIDATTIA